MGSYYFSSGPDFRDEFGIDIGPNAKNDAKVLLAKKKKEYQNTHIVTLAVRNGWGEERCFIVCVPTPAHREVLEAEAEEWRKLHPEDYIPYRRGPGERKKRRRSRKPELDELDRLERDLTRPRSRHLHGWGRIYLPTRKCWKRRDDKRNWKRHRITQYR